MDKFCKRVTKISKNCHNAVVVGDVFGNLEKVLLIYQSVFVIGNNQPLIKAKNLIFRETFQNLNQLTEVNGIFFDLKHIMQLENLKEVWQRNDSKIFIEGNDPIERNFSKPLYETNWGCTSLQGNFHVWERMK